MDDKRPLCDWKLDINGFASIKDSKEPPGGCRIPHEFRGWIAQETLVDQYGHEVDGDSPKLDKCNHVNTPEYKAAHAKSHHHKKRLVKAVQREPSTVPPRADPLPTMEPPSAPALAKIETPPIPPVKSNNMTLYAVSTIILVIIVILALISKSKNKKTSSSDSHGQCKTDIAKIANSVSQLEIKIENISKELHSKIDSVGKMQGQMTSFSKDDAEEMFEPVEKRLKKLEKLSKVKHESPVKKS